MHCLGCHYSTLNLCTGILGDFWTHSTPLVVNYTKTMSENKRPYKYSKGTYTFDKIGDRIEAVKDIQKRVDALQAVWKKCSPEEKKRKRETYIAKMKALAEEKNRLAKNCGYAWRYHYNSMQDKIQHTRKKAAGFLWLGELLGY